MRPNPKLASTGYCLASEGVEYVTLLPESAKGPLQMTLPPGKYTVEWLRLVRGSPTAVKPIQVKCLSFGCRSTYKSGSISFAVAVVLTVALTAIGLGHRMLNQDSRAP
jgi:hypothetical protein